MTCTGFGNGNSHPSYLFKNSHLILLENGKLLMQRWKLGLNIRQVLLELL